MCKSIWKPLFFNKNLFIKVFRLKKKNSKKKYFLIYNKTSTIVNTFVGVLVRIYKGNLYRKLFITKYIIGFKFGEFAYTRKPFLYPLKKKKR